MNEGKVVVGDILHALDTGNIALLTLLDLSTAFDSVDHSVLLQRPQKLYGLHGTVIGWFASYLTLRSQYVRTPASKSTSSFVLYGVPQGSVLGQILFVLYVADVWQLVKDHGLMPHAYADDTQILRICCLSWGLPRCGCYHARSCYLNCPGVLRYTTPDEFCAPLSDTSSFDNSAVCTCYQ